MEFRINPPVEEITLNFNIMSDDDSIDEVEGQGEIEDSGNYSNPELLQITDMVEFLLSCTQHHQIRDEPPFFVYDYDEQHVVYVERPSFSSLDHGAIKDIQESVEEVFPMLVDRVTFTDDDAVDKNPFFSVYLQ